MPHASDAQHPHNPDELSGSGFVPSAQQHQSANSHQAPAYSGSAIGKRLQLTLFAVIHLLMPFLACHK